MPANKQTIRNIFLIKLFPFNIDKWAPKYPHVNEHINNSTKIFNGTNPILIKRES